MEILAAVALILQVSGAGAVAQDQNPAAVAPPQDERTQTPETRRPEQPRQEGRVDPILAGWSSEPAMAAGGLTLASAQRAASRLLGSSDAAKAHPGLQAAWEFPVAEVLSIVTHEFNGHGGRAREFGLHPVYGFDLLRLSAYTGTTRVPKNRDEIISVSAAGTEADSVLANRLLVDLLRPDGAEGATVPLALFAKLDLTLYVLTTPRATAANADEFQSGYQEGNDIANYLVARQGLRRGLSLDDLWNQVADIDFNDALLRKNDDAARVAALWNVFDPALIFATLDYARNHLGKGVVRVRPPMLELGGVVGLTAGTRAFLAPSYVTRYLDLHMRVPVGVGSIYVRDLDSSVARTWGWGGAFTLAPPGSRVSLQVTADRWDEPRSAEHGEGTRGWNVSGEARIPVTRQFGVLLGVGHKTLGFVPGRPVNAGTYVGLGVLLSLWR